MWSEIIDICLIVTTLAAFAIWRRSHPASATQRRNRERTFG